MRRCSSIYDIFKCMGVYFKYTGFIPLPGIYERGSVSKLIGSVILPFLYFVSCWYAAFVCFYLGDAKKFERNLTDILIVLLTLIAGCGYLVSPFIYRFRVSPRLVNYLSAHREIEQLIRPHKRRLTLFAYATLLVVALQAYFTYYTFLYVRFTMLSRSYARVQYVSAVNSVGIVLFVYCQPQAMYILFQHVLNTAFRQLLSEIQKRKREGEETDVGVLLRWSRLYCHLCKMGKMLDRMVSPMLVYRTLYFFVSTIYNATFLSFPLTSQTCLSMFTILNCSVILVWVPNFAYATQISALKILPAIYSSINCEEKEMRKMMEIFGIQSMYFKCSFSASGLYQLNRNLVQNVLQSIVSQWVIFYRIQNNPQNQ